MPEIVRGGGIKQKNDIENDPVYFMSAPSWATLERFPSIPADKTPTAFDEHRDAPGVGEEAGAGLEHPLALAAQAQTLPGHSLHPGAQHMQKLVGEQMQRQKHLAACGVRTVASEAPRGTCTAARTRQRP